MSQLFPLYNNVKDKAPTKYLCLAELCAYACTPTVGPKSESPALTPYFASAKTKEAALAAEFNALVIDHDHDNLTEENIRVIYDAYGVAYLAFTTASHMQEKGGITANRWKVVIPFENPARYEQFVKLAVGLTIHHGADRAQARAQQVFYAPNKLEPDAEYKFINATDSPFLVLEDEANPLVVAALSAYAKTRRRR